MLPTISAILLFSWVSATVFGVSVIVSDGSDFISLYVWGFIFLGNNVSGVTFWVSTTSDVGQV